MPKAIFNIQYTAKNPPAKYSPERKAEYMGRRTFYDMSADFNLFTYLLNDKKVVKDAGILRYMQKNANENSGAFNMDGILTEKQKEKIKKMLATTQSHIWHGVISFDAETSKGFETQDKAIHFLKQTFGAFLTRTHLKRNNIEIIASLHDDTENRHIHFAFFEKAAVRRNAEGKLVYTQKGTFAPAALENYLVSANMHLSDNSFDYYSARNRAMDRLKEIRSGGEIAKDNFNDFRIQLEELSKEIPTGGRLQYNAEEIKPYQKEIDRLAKLLVKSDPEAARLDKELRRALAAKEAEAKELVTADVTKQLIYVNDKELRSEQVQQLLKEGKTEYIRANKINWENIDYFERLRQDYRARLGNQVLGLCKDIRGDFIKRQGRPKFNNKQAKVQSRIQRRYAKNVLAKFMEALPGNHQSINADFSYKLHEAERQIKESQEVAAHENVG